MTADVAGEPAPLRWSTLRPYVSVIVLECEAEDPGQAFERLVSTLAAPVQVRKGRKDRIVAAGTVDRPDRLVNVEGVGLDQLAGFVREVRGTPRWAGLDSTFVDTVNHLVGVLRRGHLIAVHADDRTVDRLQRWLDRAPTSSLGRIPTEVLEATLLRGEAMGLWLQGTHLRRTRTCWDAPASWPPADGSTCTTSAGAPRRTTTSATGSAGWSGGIIVRADRRGLVNLGSDEASPGRRSPRNVGHSWLKTRT